jgi:hypothetical protein
MALIDKTSIGTGNTIQAEHITRIIDALNESGSYEIIATGSFTGSFVGDASGLTGVITADTASYINATNIDGTVANATSSSYSATSTTASYAHYAVSASYEINYETSSSYADFAKTASYINISEIDGEIISTTASYVETAQTASYITAANIDGTVATATSASYALTASYVETSQTSSYVLGSNVSGTVATATSASHTTEAKQLTDSNRTIYTFITTDATPYTIPAGGGPFAFVQTTRYIKAIVLGQTTTSGPSTESCGGEFVKIYDAAVLPPPVGGQVSTTISSTGTLANNYGSGTPAFSLSLYGFTATGIAATTINWKVILEVIDRV